MNAPLAATHQPRRLWTPHAWLADGWRAGVLLEIGSDGRWSSVVSGVARAPADALALDAPLLPGLVDAHSHAFQRAFAGLAECRASELDDFWSWRERMYAVAQRITPAQLRAIAAHLYVELLRGGYTQVCEFHYLRNDTDGNAYADPLELAWQLADAAGEAGLGLTLLPVLYERAGFGKPLRAEQRRFASGARDVFADAQRIAEKRAPLLAAGLAIHSLRAAAPESIAALRRLADGFDGPIHIHVAEQSAEVDDCVAASGARPIEWLARTGCLDRRWQLVHATHATRAEIDAVAASGAGVVICPSTEANLGDGLVDLPGWLEARVPLAIGSDSQVTRAWREELRWLEYAQRLALRRRNVSAAPQHGQPSTAQRLFTRTVEGSAAAAGQRAWGLVAGARADALVVDLHDHSLLGIPQANLLDALVFSSPGRPWRDVMVAGRWVVREHRHANAEGLARRFEATMRELL